MRSNRARASLIAVAAPRAALAGSSQSALASQPHDFGTGIVGRRMQANVAADTVGEFLVLLHGSMAINGKRRGRRQVHDVERDVRVEHREDGVEHIAAGRRSAVRTSTRSTPKPAARNSATERARRSPLLGMRLPPSRSNVTSRSRLRMRTVRPGGRP